jgi:hypothetical protein
MRVVARQIWWLQVIRITLGCAAVAVGVVMPWFGAEMAMRTTMQAFLAFLLGGIAFVVVGTTFAIYARLEWRPRGVAVAICRRGLILKANGFRCPKLVRIKWEQIGSARYIPPSFGFLPGWVKISLKGILPEETLPKSRGGVIEMGPYTIALNGIWELWLPEDAANLINEAVANPELRETL